MFKSDLLANKEREQWRKLVISGGNQVGARRCRLLRSRLLRNDNDFTKFLQLCQCVELSARLNVIASAVTCILWNKLQNRCFITRRRACIYYSHVHTHTRTCTGTQFPSPHFLHRWVDGWLHHLEFSSTFSAKLFTLFPNRSSTHSHVIDNVLFKFRSRPFPAVPFLSFSSTESQNSIIPYWICNHLLLALVRVLHILLFWPMLFSNYIHCSPEYLCILYEHHRTFQV